MLIALTAAGLSACSTTDPSRAAAADVAAVCPKPVPYSRETRARALAELGQLPPGAALRLFAADYARLRQQMRECREGAE